MSDDDDDKEEESKKEEGPLEMEVEEGWREDSLAKEDVTGDMDTSEFFVCQSVWEEREVMWRGGEGYECGERRGL